MIMNEDTVETAPEMDGKLCNGLLHGWCNGRHQSRIESDAMDRLQLCKLFMLFRLCLCICWMWTDHNRSHQPSINFAIRKLVLIYIHKKETKDSQRTSCSTPWWCLSCSLWRHLSCSPFCHVLSGAEYIITRAGTRAHVDLFSDNIFWRFKRWPKRPPPKRHETTFIIHITTHRHFLFSHHDDSLLLWWMW